MLQPQPIPASHEAAFLERYQRLYRWSLALTRNNQQQAEDLLHDAYVQFLLSHPNLGAIQNLDGYLHTILKNMRVSQLRRATRLQEASYALAANSLDSILLLPDHLSLEHGLSSAEQLTQAQIREELQRTCQYAIMRKTSSRVGSVLILRFFLGYYPQEIAQILRSSRAVVDKLLQRARGEARLFLSEPTSLSFIKSNPSTDVLPAETMSESCSLNEFLQSLREAIYRAAVPTCAGTKTMRRWYGGKSGAAPAGPSTQELNHLVSCPRCLDQVNEVLGLPLLAARQPAKMMGPDSRKHDKDGKDGKRGGGTPGGSGGGVRETFLERSKRRFKDAFEHRPQELCVCVNGFLLGSQRVNSEYNEQALSIKREERVGFVEVFSERETRLLFYCVEAPPDGPVEHHQHVDLSDGRSLELSLDFSTESPNLELLYHDPTLAAEALTELKEANSEDGSTEAGSMSFSSAAPTEGDAPQEAKVYRTLHAAGSWWRRFVDLNLWVRPAPVTAVIALVLIAAFLVSRYMQPTAPLPLAADLLQRAAVAENAIASRPDQVMHRTLRFEERSATGDLIAQRRIEIWHSAEKETTARRVYDDRGQLIAGDWIRRDAGSQRRGDAETRTVYFNHALKEKSSTEEAKKSIESRQSRQFAIGNLEAWQLSPSAKEFSSLIGDVTIARVEERGNAFVITLSAESVKSADNSAPSANTSVPSMVKSASLVLNKSDLHPREETLLIAQGAETREYRFVEIAFEQKAINDVAPSVFEPEPELLAADTGKGRSGDTEKITPSPSLPVSSSPSVTATADTEVEALQLLNQIGADLGQEVSVKRESDGALHIEAIVESAKRKNEILSALAPLARDPAVKMRIETNAEAQARIERERRRLQTKSGTSEVALEGQSTANSIPVDADVRRYLQSKGISGKQLDDEVSRLSNRMINRSHQAMLHAFALKNLTERFSPEELRSLDPTAHAKWRSMIAGHASAFLRDVGAMRQELTAIFGTPSSASGDEGVDVSGDASLLRAASRLAQLASVLNEGIQSDFTISTGGRNSIVKTPQFWRSLKSTERIAGALQNRER